MGNITINLINTTLSPAQIASIQAAIATILAELAAVLQTLIDEQRDSLLSMDVNNRVFAEQALEEATVNGSMLPSAVNAGFLDSDLVLHEQLGAIESMLQGVLLQVRDSKRVVGHEAYAMALTIYTLYKSLAAVGVPGAQQSADRLGERFAQQQQGGPQGQNP